jgi:hypothetical protein
LKLSGRGLQTNTTQRSRGWVPSPYIDDGFVADLLRSDPEVPKASLHQMPWPRNATLSTNVQSEDVAHNPLSAPTANPTSQSKSQQLTTTFSVQTYRLGGSVSGAVSHHPRNCPLGDVSSWTPCSSGGPTTLLTQASNCCQICRAERHNIRQPVNCSHKNHSFICRQRLLKHNH